jgi:NO-binding membrane sensor protein with MHYT domain
MHYIGMAALHIYPPVAAHGMAGMLGRASAGAFLVPLIFGITILTMVVTADDHTSPER